MYIIYVSLNTLSSSFCLTARANQLPLIWSSHIQPWPFIQTIVFTFSIHLNLYTHNSCMHLNSTYIFDDTVFTLLSQLSNFVQNETILTCKSTRKVVIPSSPYTIYDGVDRFRFKINLKYFSWTRSIISRFPNHHDSQPYNKTDLIVLLNKSYVCLLVNLKSWFS